MKSDAGLATDSPLAEAPLAIGSQPVVVCWFACYGPERQEADGYGPTGRVQVASCEPDEDAHTTTTRNTEPMVKRFAVLVLLLGIGGAGFTFWQHNGTKEAQQSHYLQLHGNIDIRQVDLAINGTERIARLWVEEGDEVVPGQKMAQLELGRFRLAVAAASKAVEAQRQLVAKLETGSRPEEIAKAQADYEAAVAVQEEAKQSYERIRSLAENNAASQQQLDDATAAYRSAQARVQSAKATLDLVRAGPRTEEIAQAKAVLGQRRTELRLARHLLADATLLAPHPGIVQSRILEVGDMATPQKTVYTLALHDPVWVRAYVEEIDLGRIREGMHALILTDSFPDKQYEGWIGYISPTAEFTPKPVETSEVRTKLVYQIRVFANNPMRELRLGMPATVRIDLEQPAKGRPSQKGKDPSREDSQERTQKSKQESVERPPGENSSAPSAEAADRVES